MIETNSNSITEPVMTLREHVLAFALGVTIFNGLIMAPMFLPDGGGVWTFLQKYPFLLPLALLILAALTTGAMKGSAVVSSKNKVSAETDKVMISEENGNDEVIVFNDTMLSRRSLPVLNKETIIDPEKVSDDDVLSSDFFDAALLADMAEALGYDDFVMLFGKFQANAFEQLEKLDGAILDKDAEQIVSVAHRLVGLFAQFGVRQVADLAGKTEVEMNDACRIEFARTLQECGTLSLAHVERMLEEQPFFPDKKNG